MCEGEGRWVKYVLKECVLVAEDYIPIVITQAQIQVELARDDAVGDVVRDLGVAAHGGQVAFEIAALLDLVVPLGLAVSF